MVKKATCALLALLCLLPLTGCWNYRGMNELAIVSGFAIDINPENGNYVLTFEIVDTSRPLKTEGFAGKLFRSEGETLFDAIRNAKRKLTNKLYFGHDQVVIISQEVARSQDIVSTVDFLLRDGESRETMCVIISQEKTAGEIFDAEGIDQSLVSYNLHKIMKEDKNVTGSSLNVELYELFEISNSPGRSVALPALRCVEGKEKDKRENEINGLAVFKEDRLIGFLPAEDTKYFLFATDSFGKGVLPFEDPAYQSPHASGHDSDMTMSRGTLEISKSKTKYTIESEGGQLKIILNLKLTAFLGELTEAHQVLTEDKLHTLESEAEEELNEKVTAVIKKIQTEFESDILGFGNLIYKRKHTLWKELEDDWDKKFPQLEIEVKSDITIINTALLKQV